MQPLPNMMRSLPGVSAAAPGTPGCAPPPPGAGAPTGGGSCGRFLILRRHAEGGLGLVSVALDESLHRRVALKQIRPELAGDLAARLRFINEAQIAGQLEHPGIVPVYALGQDEDACPYYAMRFVEGPTLDEAIARYHANPDALGFNDLLQRFVDLCRAVAYAHSQGVIHRDLKPQNVLVGMYGETILLDWGLAKRLADGAEAAVEEPPGAAPSAGSVVTDDGSPLGTPAYMAPEQATGKAGPTATTADIYSLGAILYQILTGRPPYTEVHAKETLERLAMASPPAPSSVRRAVPRALEAICLKAMSRRPEDRYAHADYVATDIDRFRAGQTVEVYGESVIERVSRWAQAHKVLVLWAIVALVVAVAALGLEMVTRG